MMRALLRAALGALAVVVMAMPATAAKYGWPTSYTGNEWMNEMIGRSDDDVEAEPQSSTGRGKGVSRQASANQGAAPRVKRRLPTVNYDDVGSGAGGQSGVASYYWQPQRVASGGRFNPNAMTAAHKSLPFGTKVRVTHRSTGRAVTVTINDRGPFVAGRIIDLSSAAAGVLGMKGSGVAKVSLTVLGR